MEFLNLHKNRKSAFWGSLLTFFLVIILYGLFQLPFSLYMVVGEDGNFIIPYETLEINLNYLLILLSLSFFGILLGFIISFKAIHKESFFNLVNATGKLDFGRIINGFKIWTGILLLFFVLDYFFISGPDFFTYRPVDWNFIFLIVVSFVVLFVQTFAEEIMFRGYILQIFGKLFAYRWIPILISGLIFGLVHMQNPEVEEYGYGIMMLHYCSAGIFLGLIAVMDNRLELAIGFHAANNIISSILMNFEGSVFKTYALFSTPEIDPYIGYVTWFISCIIFYNWAKRKYNWKPINYIFGKSIVVSQITK